MIGSGEGFGPAGPGAGESPPFAVAGPSQVTVDASRSGTGSFTVSNVTGRAVRARVLILPGAGADASWFEVQGDSERALPVAGTTTVDVSVQVPEDAPAEAFSFVLGAALEESPDQVVSGPTVTFQVPEPKKRKFPWWIVVVAAAAVLLLAAGAILVRNLTQVEVPTVIGSTQTQATGLLEDSGLVAKAETINGDAGTKGQVIKQDPTSGKTVDKGSTVVITVNEGPVTVNIPDNLVGMNVGDAQKALAEAGFTNVKTETAAPGQGPKNAAKDDVLSVSPVGGSDAEPGSEVLLTIDSGQVKVPNFVSMTVARAQDSASKNGFPIRIRPFRAFPPRKSGIVYRQSPTAGSTTGRGTRVTLYVGV